MFNPRVLNTALKIVVKKRSAKYATLAGNRAISVIRIFCAHGPTQAMLVRALYLAITTADRVEPV